MDERKVFGVQQALGKGVAKGGKENLDLLRKTGSREAFVAFLRENAGALPQKLVDEYLQVPTEADWEKHRAKVILAAKVALGQTQVVKGHEQDPFAEAEKALRE